MIEVRNLSVDYRDKRALDDISLTLHNGKLTVLAAPNGGGKSTLMKAIVGLQEISAGEIIIDGSPFQTLSRAETARRVAYMAQSRNTPNIQAKRMVLHGRFPYLSYPRKYRKEDYEIAEEALRQVDAADLADSFLPELSGGMRQRIYFAMTLAQSTDNVLMDEPLNFLDISHQIEFIRLMKNMALQGKSVTAVVHDIRIAMQEADEIIVLENGRLAMEGTPEEVYSSGVISRVFGVDLAYVDTDKGRRYYYI